MTFIKPMLAKKTDNGAVPKGDYVYEVKWDGMRAMVVWDKDDSIHIYSRSGRDITAQFPELIHNDVHDLLCCQSAVFDAEIVCLKNGVAHFPSITSRLHLKTGREEAAEENPVNLALFDMLNINGKGLTHDKLMHRKNFLDGAIFEDGPLILSRAYENGDELYSHEMSRGAEGIIAKRRDSLYLPGRRTKDWLKVKIMYEETVQIYGFTSGKGKRLGQFGSLMFRELDDGTGGSVGTGFTDHELKEMTAILQSREPKEVKPGVFMLTEPFLAKVKGMRKNKSGAIREPVYIKTVFED